MACSSSNLPVSVLLLAGLALTAAAPSTWNVKHVYSDSINAEGQWSPPTIHRCACFAKVDPETNKTEWFCTENSDPRCRQLPIGKFTKVQERVLNQGEVHKTHQCVCYLEVSEDPNFVDFSCSAPHCYQHFLESQETANTNRWPNYECDETQKHPTDPDCCRCINHKWNCLLYRWFNCRRVNCPESRQVKVPGKCCPVCLEANMPSPDSVPSVESNPARAPLIADDTLQSCDCSACKNVNARTGELDITLSRSHPECQCDLYVQYPYNELPMCQTEESNQKFPDKLANELADETNWD